MRGACVASRGRACVRAHENSMKFYCLLMAASSPILVDLEDDYPQQGIIIILLLSLSLSLSLSLLSSPTSLDILESYLYFCKPSSLSIGDHVPIAMHILSYTFTSTNHLQ